ncbi:MAG: hypothetical protein FJW66_03295 [Actinobacteria bacterium]|nr:hypothetical protein [Actinomycetota bacterium]
MLCEFCKKNEANVHLIKVVNGETEKMNICVNCLKDFTFLPEEDFYNDLSTILKKVLEVDIKISDKTDAEKFFESLSSTDKRACSTCGIDLASIKSAGRVGCPDCYIEFRDAFTPILKSIHGSATHRGRIPARPSVELKIEKEIRDLEHRLKEVITIEDFEEAAKLRDTIKKLRKKLSIGRKNS